MTRWISALLITALVVVPSGVMAQSGISVEIEAAKPLFRSTDSVLVDVILTNNTKQDVLILLRHTPFLTLSRSLFEVTLDDQKVEYIGPYVNWGHPNENDYTVLLAGESRSERVDLGESYDLSGSGEYSVRYASTHRLVFDSQEDKNKGSQGWLDAANLSHREPLESNTITFSAEGRPPRSQTWPSSGSLQPQSTRVRQYTGCNSSQTFAIQSAEAQANTYAQNAVSTMNAGFGNAYQEWFGEYNGSRFQEVKDNYNKIRAAFSSPGPTYDCSTCTTSPFRDAFAYVYPHQPYRIYLCNLFWSAPLSGEDSRGGTLVHEMSHFTVVAGTVDVPGYYGSDNCRDLARTNPGSAIRNADNYEFFCELGYTGGGPSGCFACHG